MIWQREQTIKVKNLAAHVVSRFHAFHVSYILKRCLILFQPWYNKLLLHVIHIAWEITYAIHGGMAYRFAKYLCKLIRGKSMLYHSFFVYKTSYIKLYNTRMRVTFSTESSATGVRKFKRLILQPRMKRKLEIEKNAHLLSFVVWKNIRKLNLTLNIYFSHRDNRIDRNKVTNE